MRELKSVTECTEMCQRDANRGESAAQRGGATNLALGHSRILP